jgi:fucose 4-O-acetylase-like acetyltransferase
MDWGRNIFNNREKAVMADINYVIAPPRAAPAIKSAARMAWLDAAKGIGIILVVAFHVVGGALRSGLLPQNGLLDDTFYAVYTFHMPFFFFLSGVLLKDRLHNRAEVKSLILASGLKLLYPYFLWGYIQVLVIFALGKFVNTPISLGWLDIVSPLWSPPSQFWFIYVLFFLQMIAVLFLWFSMDLALLCVAVMARVLAASFGLQTVIDEMCLFGIFYVAGVLLGPRMKQWPTMLRHPALVSAVLLVVASANAMWALGAGITNYYSLYTLPAAIIGTAALLALSAVPQVSSNAILNLLGRRTLTIYLTHILCVAGARILMVKFLHISSPWIVLPVAIVLGLAVPVFFYDLAQKLKLKAVLGLS